MYKFWKNSDDLGFQIIGYGTLYPDNQTVVFLQSIDGHLNECVRATEINTLYKEAPELANKEITP